MLGRLLLLAGIPSLVFSTLFILDEYRSGEIHLEQMSRQVHANIVQEQGGLPPMEQVQTYLAPLAESALLKPGDAGRPLQALRRQRSALQRGRGDRAFQAQMKAFRPPGQGTGPGQGGHRRANVVICLRAGQCMANEGCCRTVRPREEAQRRGPWDGHALRHAGWAHARIARAHFPESLGHTVFCSPFPSWPISWPAELPGPWKS